MSYANAEALIAEFMAHPERLSAWIHAVDDLLDDRRALLKLIPVCPVHGDECSAHAREWIQRQLAQDREPWWEE